MELIKKNKNNKGIKKMFKINKLTKICLLLLAIFFIALGVRYFVLDPSNNVSDILVDKDTLLMADGEIYFHDLFSTTYVGTYQKTTQPIESDKIKKLKFENITYYQEIHATDGLAYCYIPYKNEWYKITMSHGLQKSKREVRSFKARVKGYMNEIFWIIY